MPEPMSSILDMERIAASISNNYDSQKMRKIIEESFSHAFKGMTKAYSWQVDIMEALLLGLDCMVITGTGCGKTMPFVMPLLVDKSKKKTMFVISPLNDLELEQVSLLLISKMFLLSIFCPSQARKFRAMG